MGILNKSSRNFYVKEIKAEDQYKNQNYRMTLDEIDDYEFLRQLMRNFLKMR